MTFDPDAAPFEQAWLEILKDKEKRAALLNAKSAKVTTSDAQGEANG
jgi:hypothetical protein